MSRLIDWSPRLTAVFVAARGRTFVYGEHDCCIFAADCVLAVTGRDVAADWRGRYATWDGGMRLAKARSVATLARRLFKPVMPSMAWRGDIAAVRLGRKDFGLMVFDGAYLRGGAGTIAARSEALKAWRVE
jgi:hypothetical protein